MDIVYNRAITQASRAWSQQRVVDTQTLAALRRGEQTAADKTAAATAAQQALLQPELARFGLLGTRLNLFA